MENHKGYSNDDIEYPVRALSEYPSDVFQSLAYPCESLGFAGVEQLGYVGYETEAAYPSCMKLQAASYGECSRPLRMACIGPNFRVGGVRQHALALAKFLNPDKLKITEFLVFDDGEVDACEPGLMPAPVRRFEPAAMERLERDFDILLLWGDSYNNKLTCKGPLKVFVAHGETPWTRNSLVQSSQVVDHVIAVSESVLKNVCQGFPATKILNGIDTSRLGQTDTRENIRRRYAFANDDFVVGCVGRLTQEKQFDLMIRAISTLPPNYKLLIVGSGRRYAEWLDLANRMIPGRCVIVSSQNYLGDFYQAMDAFGLVSSHEGFGLVLAEAMMAGRPVFSTRVGVAPEVICDRVNGVLVNSDAQSIASAVKQIRTNRPWAQGMAAQGRVLAMNLFNASQMACRYENLLCELFFAREASGSHLPK